MLFTPVEDLACLHFCSRAIRTQLSVLRCTEEAPGLLTILCLTPSSTCHRVETESQSRPDAAALGRTKRPSYCNSVQELRETQAERGCLAVSCPPPA